MRTYQVTIEIDEGNDEFWEDVTRLKDREAKVMVRDEIARCLAQHGFVRPACRVDAIGLKRS